MGSPPVLFWGVGGALLVTFVGVIFRYSDGLIDGIREGFTVGIEEGRFEGFGMKLGAEVGVRVLLARAFVIK